MSSFQFETYQSEQILGIQRLLQDKGIINDPDIVAFLENAATVADYRDQDIEQQFGAVGTAYGIGVSRQATQSIPNAAGTAVSFDTLDYDSTGLSWSTTTVTVGLRGIYRITGLVTFAAAAGGDRGALIFLNGTELTGNLFPTPAQAPRISASDELPLAEGDQITLQAYQSSGGALNLTKATLRVVTAGAQGG